MQPEVTILLATYNGELYIDKLIDSLIAQTYKNWKLLISDDCSTDATPMHIKAYCNKYPDKITVLQSERRFGSAKDNFFFLLSKCAAQYIMFCDQDDFWLPEKIEKTLNLMLETEGKNPSVPVLVHTDLKIADGKLNITDASFMHYTQLDSKRNKLNNLIIQNIVTGCTVMINSRLNEFIDYEKLSTKNILMHDWYLALIASSLGVINFLNESTILYRQHGDNSVGAKKKDVKYIINKLRNNDMKTSMNNTMLQAGYFAETYKNMLLPSDYELCSGYASIVNKGKLSRIRFFCRYKVFKYDFARMAAQFIWA